MKHGQTKRKTKKKNNKSKKTLIIVIVSIILAICLFPGGGFVTWKFFIKEEDLYERYSESFSERAYSLEFVEKVLNKYNFVVDGVFGDLTTEPPKDNEERIIIIARKV